MLPLLLQGLSFPRAATEVEQTLLPLGLESMADRAVGRLSRGEQQRVAIARGVVGQPTLLLADEPFTGVDKANQAAIENLLQGLLTRGTAIICAFHGATGRLQSNCTISLS